MEPLNDNMDDLFRKAGKFYPLNTDGSDWGAILHQLDSKAVDLNIPRGESDKTRRNYSKYLWLLLLLLSPLGIVSLNHLNPKMEDGNIKLPGKLKPNTNNSPAASNFYGKTAVRNPTQNLHRELSSMAGLPMPEPRTTKAEIADKLPYASENESGRPFKKSDKAAPGLPYENFPENKNMNPAKAAEVDSFTAADKRKTTSMASEKSKNSASNNTIAQSAHNKSKEDKKALNGKFYLSIIGAPDASTIKNQSIKGIGYSVGLLPGYRLSHRLSIETGLFWDRKDYYSEGAYFNKRKTGIPSYVNLLDIKGDCNMFEVPLNLRYNFGSQGQGRFYIIAGLSSYFMKKEDYNYLAQVNNGPPYDVHWTYHNSGNTLISAINISGGYNQKMGKIGSIRVEPYWKIPLRGVGIGNLPISSYGLYLGITHPFK